MTQEGSQFDWIVACQQLYDTALPTGAYAHSHGLEGLVQEGTVVDASGVSGFLHNEVADSLIQSDLPVFREAYLAIQNHNFLNITELDELALALKPSHELRRAGAQIGRQTWRLYGQLFPAESVEQSSYCRCSEFLGEYQATVVYGVLSSILGIPLKVAMAAYARQVIANFAQACIKLLSFGPTQVQGIIRSTGGRIPSWVDQSMAVAIEDTGSMAPHWDIASARHQFSECRLYIS